MVVGLIPENKAIAALDVVEGENEYLGLPPPSRMS
jgi:hypothetical protein